MRLSLILLAVPLLFSFKFNPMSQSLELADGRKSSQFTVENDTDTSMAIELTVKERKMDSTGKEDLPATAELSIFPPQIIIPPKEKRTIRVSWNGPMDLKSEKAFRVIAEQLQVNVDEKTKKQTGIQIMMKYMAAFYVTPKDVEPKLDVSIVSKNPLKVKVTNAGSRHQVLLKPKLVFKKGSDKWTFEEKDLVGFAGENVLSHSERIFEIKTNKNIASDSEVSLKVEK